MKENKNWVVTGASGGIGAVLVEKLLEKGFCVAALSRTPEKIEARHGAQERLRAIGVDVRSEESVLKAREEAKAFLGRVDVVVNTAGYGLGGAIEEVSDQEARAVFDVNVFGALNVCRHFVTDLREQGGGCVINFACMDSVIATEYNAVYHATKYAMDALTDALNKEAGQFGIRAICVKNGPMRTGYLDNKQYATAQLEVYQQARRENQANEARYGAAAAADPKKVAELLIRLSGEEEVPKDLYLTRESVQAIREKWDALEQEFETWKWATLCVDFPKEECYYGKRS